MEEVRGRRIVALRQLLRLTQLDLAERTGISQPHLSLMERGERTVSDESVHQMAMATSMPATFFDMVPSDISAKSLTFRKTAGSSVASREAVVIRYAELERISAELSRDAGLVHSELPFADGDLFGDDIEELAERTRAILKLEPLDPIRNLSRAMERAGIAVAPLVASGDPDELMHGHDGVSWARPDAEHLLVGYVPGRSGDRERLSKGHELGHIVLHTHRPWVLEKIKEREAFRFAGALLVPAEAMRASVSNSLSLNGFVSLKAQWGVSIAALITRAKDLDLISDSREKSLRIQLSSKGWRKQEPVVVGNEEPRLLWHLLVTKFGAEPYMKATHKLGMRPDLLREWIPEGPSRSGSASKPRITMDRTPSNVVSLFK
jgi:Zn-dependent peptidase ImmA (M78 family)/DNA-binding XRE family transcriptional regulator